MPKWFKKELIWSNIFENILVLYTVTVPGGDKVTQTHRHLLLKWHGQSCSLDYQNFTIYLFECVCADQPILSKESWFLKYVFKKDGVHPLTSSIIQATIYSTNRGWPVACTTCNIFLTRQNTPIFGHTFCACQSPLRLLLYICM